MLLLAACTLGNENSTDKSEAVTSTVLQKCEDLGEEYIDSFIFIGESATYHLKSRGVLKGGKDTTQVWCPRSGTANLDTTIGTLKIVYPDSGEEMTISEATRLKCPRRIMLTFGLNGAVTKINQGKEYFKTCYLSLINSIREASPDTVIIIQSCFPIAENMDMSNYTVDAKTLNEYIDTINGWALSLANEQGIGYLDTQEILRDEKGFLRSDYQAGDGYHLSAAACNEILMYIRTHDFGE
jgi:lysophospholipase L1-like esterase